MKKSDEKLSAQELIDMDICPNCWGRQEYQDRFVAEYDGVTKSNMNQNRSHRKAFILKFVETHVSGIKLKKDGDSRTCHGCKSSFKQ